MTKILIDRAAVEQALEALQIGDAWHPTTVAAIKALVAALAEPVQEPQGCAHCNHPLYAATKCRVCGRVTEVVQEPVAWRFEARHIDSAWAAAVSLKHPGPEGKYMRNVVPLYTTPLQRKPEPNSDYERGFVDGMSEQARRSVDKAVNAMTKCKPLAEEEIARLVTNDMVKFARAVERAHGIGGEE